MARLMRFVPCNVMVGFVNVLTILIILARSPNFGTCPGPSLRVAARPALMILFPRITKASRRWWCQS